MDWKAIEANEALLQKYIDIANAEGNKAAAMSFELQKGLLRPWCVWLAKYHGDAENVTEAFTATLGSMLAEAANNLVMVDENDKPASLIEKVMHFMKKVIWHATHAGREIDEGTAIRAEGIDLTARGDA